MSRSTGDRPTGYRTLVTGKLRQLSPLCVGGDVAEPGGVDRTAFRDGSGRLTIPGSGLAGALVETLSRLCPPAPAPRAGGARCSTPNKL